ncbi:hypothetical protein FACS1894127_7640 [Clostridia bacterium]|nr:hypothetical protein FACS1894127_7640 [Clostridia bacterium]
MPKVNEAVINYRVFEDGSELLGTAEVTLPEISNMTQEIQGAGIAGTTTSSIIGHISAMMLTLNFRTVEPSAVSLYEPRRHNIELRVAQQSRNSATGTLEVSAVKYVLVVTPTKLSPGKAAPASPADASGEYAVDYYACFMNGNQMFEVDQLNFIFKVNGKDYLADVRAALGM